MKHLVFRSLVLGTLLLVAFTGIVSADAPRASVGGVVFLDENGDGVQSFVEPGLAGVGVDLYYDVNGNGIVDGEDIWWQRAQTDDQGTYIFVQQKIHDYVLQVVTPEGYTHTTALAYSVPAEWLDHDVSGGRLFDFGLAVDKEVGPSGDFMMFLGLVLQ